MLKSYLLSLCLIFSAALVSAQPFRLEGNWSGSWQATCCNLNDRGGVLAYRVQANGTATRQFLFNNSSGSYDPKWAANSGSESRALNTKLDGQAIRFTSGGADMTFSATDGRYYTFIVGKNAGGNNDMSVLETTFNPVTITNVTVPSGTVFPGQTTTIEVTLGAAKNADEKVFIRYAKNGDWANATFVEFTSFDASFKSTITIPAADNAPSTTISYYVATVRSAYTPANSDIDYQTLEIKNNSNSNYSYSVAAAWTTASDGNWGTGSTWTAGAVPPTNQPTQINHDVTVAASLTQTNAITVASGKTLTVPSGQTLAIGAGITGAGALTVNGTLQINNGGFSNIAPSYGSNSTLIYNSGDTYGASTEWTANAASGTGVPHHVQVGNGASNSKLQFNNTGYRQCTGNMTVGTGSGSGYELLLNSSDLKIAGNYTFNNGSVSNGGKAVFFVGSSNQTTSNSAGTVFFDYLIVDKPSGSLIFGDNVTINTTSGDVLQMLNSGSIDLNGKNLNLNNNGGNITTNGTGRTITSSVAGATININADKNITNSSGGTLIFGENVTVSLNNDGTGLNFGSNICTLNGTLKINTGTFVDTNAPTYGSNSTLLYNLTGDYNRTTEWNSSSLQHVVVQGPFNLYLGTNSISSLKMAGNLTISSGSVVQMNNNLAIPLEVGGNTLNEGTLTLSDATGGDLYLKGNFTQNGTFNCNDREVRFVGTSSQTIGGTESVAIDYFRINNSAGVVLNRSVEVDNELRLDNGIISTTSSNLLTLNNGATSSTGSASSFVSGPLRKIGNSPSNFVFSTGKGSVWARIGINISGSSTTDAFTAEYFDSGAPNRTALASGLARVSAIEHWTLDRSGSTNSAAVTLYWQSDTYSDINNSSSLRVCRYNGTEWVSEGQASISFGSSGNITSNSISSFSPFSFGSTEAANNPLPLDLVWWKGSAEFDHNLLIWKTENEREIHHFEIERSQTGSDFQRIAQVYPPQNYEWKDFEFFTPVSYYRLKIVDANGSFRYSKVLAITRKSGWQDVFVVSPSPIEASTLTFKISSFVREKGDFEVWDAKGRMILSFAFFLEAGVNEVSQFFGYGSGVYVLRHSQSGRNVRFVVE